tara:strand:+ start:853 stop:1005 length:153 start_codon:yes stop_codon:yes gene_type:complete
MINLAIIATTLVAACIGYGHGKTVEKIEQNKKDRQDFIKQMNQISKELRQ